MVGVGMEEGVVVETRMGKGNEMDEIRNRGNIGEVRRTVHKN